MADVNRGNRPLSPHLQIYRPQITSVLSILHRMTGAGLALVPLLRSQLYGVDPSAACHYSDPIGGATNVTGGVNVATAYGSRETSNVQARQTVEHGHERRDPHVRSYLRGRYD